MLNLIMKLPNFILLWLSGKKQITIGNRSLLPAFQLICVQNEKLGLDISQLSPDDFRSTYNAQNIFSIGLNHISTNNHQVQVSDGSIEVREYSSKQIEKNGASLVYFHGGGWVIGNTDTHDNVCRYLCERLNIKIFSVDYRLSPEFKFPTPLDDCLSAYEWLINNHENLNIDPEKISVGGDSAGGNLAASLCLIRKSEEKSLPQAQLLIYPVTDLRFLTNSIQKECSEGFLLTKDMMEWFAGHYLDNQELREDARVSPLLAENIDGLPPAVIVTAGFDPLRDEGLAYSEKLKQANNEVTYIEFPRYIHGFFNMLQIPGIKVSVDEICSEFKSYLK
jgi:acetyl esterase